LIAIHVSGQKIPWFGRLASQTFEPLGKIFHDAEGNLNQVAADVRRL
jgi:hypothetical protein